MNSTVVIPSYNEINDNNRGLPDTQARVPAPEDPTTT